MGGPKKGRWFFKARWYSLQLPGTAGLVASKLPPESTDGTGVDALVDPYHTNTTDRHGAAVLALNLQMFVVPVADNALSFSFLLGFSAPARGYCQVTSVVYGMSAMLV